MLFRISRVVEELTKRFADYLKTGNESAIAPDIERATYTTVRVPEYLQLEHT